MPPSCAAVPRRACPAADPVSSWAGRPWKGARGNARCYRAAAPGARSGGAPDISNPAAARLERNRSPTAALAGYLLQKDLFAGPGWPLLHISFALRGPHGELREG